jgi:selenocysteine lyase/cysteine desulfurase
MRTVIGGAPATPTPSQPALMGQAVRVPLVTGESVPYTNLDYAASTPPLLDVAEAVTEFLPLYSSVHRGAGYKSQVATAAYEGARCTIGRFFDARADDVTIFVRNTTDALNLLAAALPDRASVVTFASEHHANLLPWRRSTRGVTHLRLPSSGAEAVERLEAHLRAKGADVVALTGASNVTGEVWPVRDLSGVAHRYGARVVLDAAQLAPHLPVSMRQLDVDYLAASGHKLYAPYGAGVLIGRPDWLSQGAPYLRGGGAVDFVTTHEVLWTELPDRQEAGSPNVVGAVALGVAAESLRAFGMERIATEEVQLGAYALERLQALPGIKVFRLWPEGARRIGVVTFNLAGYDHALLAAILSAEFGIGVRHGCFCAHPLMVTLLRVAGSETEAIREAVRGGDRSRLPGAVRLSLGLGSARSDVDRLVGALTRLSMEGARWAYRRSESTGEYLPSPETRPQPRWRSRPLTRVLDPSGASAV